MNIKIQTHDYWGKANFIEQMKYGELDYGIWHYRTIEAAMNPSTICIWKIKWKS